MSNLVSLEKLEGEMIRYNERSDKVLRFVCPKCDSGHSILVNFELPPIYDSGAVWNKSGDISNLSVTPSINCDFPDSSCKFHGWIKDGNVTW